MNRILPRCRICENEKIDGQQWFLLIGNKWEDKLKILSWSDRLADGEVMHPACSPSHVQQLVAHWMATGSLDYPFASSPARSIVAPHLSESLSELDFPSALKESFALAELTVHRESLRQVLMGNPESLVPILDALIISLYQEIATDEGTHAGSSKRANRSEFTLVVNHQTA